MMHRLSTQRLLWIQVSPYYRPLIKCESNLETLICEV
jgi:hypothetical protein